MSTGCAGLSMRALAAALGTGTDDDLQPRRASRRSRGAGDRGGGGARRDWPRRRVGRRLARRASARSPTAIWRAVRAHPQAIPLHPHPAQPFVGGARCRRGAARRPGTQRPSGADLLIAFRTVNALVMGFAQAEFAGPLSRDRGRASRPAVIRRFRALPKRPLSAPDRDRHGGGDERGRSGVPGRVGVGAAWAGWRTGEQATAAVEWLMPIFLWISPPRSDTHAAARRDACSARRSASSARISSVEHMESENVHDFDATIATFSHPRYELIATGQVLRRRRGGARVLRASRTAFPDQRNELIACTTPTTR